MGPSNTIKTAKDNKQKSCKKSRKVPEKRIFKPVLRGAIFYFLSAIAIMIMVCGCGNISDAEMIKYRQYEAIKSEIDTQLDQNFYIELCDAVLNKNFTGDEVREFLEKFRMSGPIKNKIIMEFESREETPAEKTEYNDAYESQTQEEEIYYLYDLNNNYVGKTTNKEEYEAFVAERNRQLEGLFAESEEVIKYNLISAECFSEKVILRYRSMTNELKTVVILVGSDRGVLNAFGLI